MVNDIGLIFNLILVKGNKQILCQNTKFY